MISIRDVRYAVGSFSLKVSLEIDKGEYFVLMGPPGAGKSVLVELVAGLRQSQGGSILIAGRDVTRAEPRRRGVGYVPQDYALFTHRSVLGNIAFGPQARGWERGETSRAVRECVELLRIGHLLDRPVHGLSGGERQRVALARALAFRPDVLILDEPVSALNEAMREEVCDDLHRLQHRLGITTLHISHNLEEAFSVADRGAVVRDGRLQQVGRMEDLLRRPANEFTARFMRCENVVDGRVTAGTETGESLISLPWGSLAVPGEHRGNVKAVIRPENILLGRPGDAAAAQPGLSLRARMLRAVDRGAYVRVTLDGSPGLVVNLSRRAFDALGAEEGTELDVTVAPGAVHVMPA